MPEDKSTLPQTNDEEIILEVKNLKKHYPIQKGFFKRIVGYVKAVDGVSFFIKKSETLGLVGESGCGKTTIGRCILRLVEPSGGEIVFNDKNSGLVHLENLSRKEMQRFRHEIQIIFQDPYSSLNPRLTVKQIISEPLVVNRIAKGKKLEDLTAELLRSVGMRPEYMNRYPHAFSGGQRQRISLARALALNPSFIVADEPVSALDVSVQAQVLNLMEDLQHKFGLTYLFISHNLSVVRHISDRVAVMYVGKVVELSGTDELFTNPSHPYTEALISAVSRPDPHLHKERIVLTGEVADPAKPPSGCYFHPRCRYVQELCKVEEPALYSISKDHFVRCHFAKELELKGIV